PDRGVPGGSPDGRTLRDITETALRQIVGSRPIDDILTVQKEAVQTDTRLKMEELNQRYSMGLDIASVLLQNVNPPSEVQDAFEDVVRAQEEQQRLINEAQSYENDQIPRARGNAAEIVEAAEGFREGRIARAEGEAAGFRNLLEGYQTSQEVTRRRLYLETMEEVLSETKRFVLTEEATGGVLPFLPLDGSQVPVPSSGTGSGSGSGSSSSGQSGGGGQ
ncbi:MAG: FtsH protease activity modulator HflK, partial [Chloroflexota bacterium]